MEAYFNRGTTYKAMNELQLAVADLNKSLKVNKQMKKLLSKGKFDRNYRERLEEPTFFYEHSGEPLEEIRLKKRN